MKRACRPLGGSRGVSIALVASGALCVAERTRVCPGVKYSVLYTPTPAACDIMITITPHTCGPVADDPGLQPLPVIRGRSS